MPNVNHYMYGKVAYMAVGEEVCVEEFECAIIGETYRIACDQLIETFLSTVAYKRILSIEVKNWEALNEHERKIVAHAYTSNVITTNVRPQTQSISWDKPKGGGFLRNHKIVHPSGLTQKQVDVVRSYVFGKSSKLIADEIGSTENNVNSMLTGIRHKLGATDRIDLIRKVIAQNIASIEEFMKGGTDVAREEDSKSE